MFKWPVAFISFPIILLVYLLELAAWGLNVLFEGLFDGVALAAKWVDKLPYPKG